jgi:hypothetical protein
MAASGAPHGLGSGLFGPESASLKGRESLHAPAPAVRGHPDNPLGALIGASHDALQISGRIHAGPGGPALSIVWAGVASHRGAVREAIWTSSWSGVTWTPPNPAEIATIRGRRAHGSTTATRRADRRHDAPGTTCGTHDQQVLRRRLNPADSTGQHRTSTNISDRHQMTTTASAGRHDKSERQFEQLWT